MFTLDHIIGIFVPSTGKNGRYISEQEYSERIDEIASKFAGLFGGYQSFLGGIGGYIGNDHQLIKEDSTLILSWASKQAYNDHYVHILLLASKLAITWDQETVAIIDNSFHLHLVGQNEIIPEQAKTPVFGG